MAKAYDPTCMVDKCERAHYSKGYCQQHWRRSRKNSVDPGPAHIAARVPGELRGPTCQVVDCDKIRRRGGYCSSHYARLLRYGDATMGGVFRGPKQSTDGECNQQGCGRPIYARRLCSSHYEMLRRDGKLPGQAPRPVCSVGPCGRSASARGLCGTHLAQVRRHGHVVRQVPNRLAKKGEGSTKRDGYRILCVKNHPLANNKRTGAMLEHRLVVASFLGRLLRADEYVHHRNGIRAENTVVPCVMSSRCECSGERHNLELWSRMQPSGKRIADLVAYAEEILRRYPRGDNNGPSL